MKNIIAVLLIFVSFPHFLYASDDAESKSVAEDKNETPDAVDTVDLNNDRSIFEKANEELDATYERRSKKTWGLSGHYALIDTWVTPKYGLSVFFLESERAWWELEYTRGSYSYDFLGVEIGSIIDKRVTLLRRWFGGRNSFSLFYGIHYSSIEITLGDEYLETVVDDSKYELLKIQTMGGTFGLGNRWQTNSAFTWGFDWLVINLPIFVLETDSPYLDETTSDSDEDDVKGVIKTVQRIPTFATLKVQLGFSW